MSNNIDQENPANNMTISPTQLTKEAKIPTFGVHPSKFEVSWIKSTPPNLIEENERCNSHC